MGTFTPRLNLYKPADNETGYGDELRQDADTLDNAALLADLAAVSGTLQSQIDSLSSSEGGNKAILGTDGNTVISGSNTITVQGFRSEFVAASGSLQSQITSNTNSIANLDSTYATDAALAAGLSSAHTELVNASGSLQSQITQNAAAISSINVDEVEPAIIGLNGISVSSGTNTTTLTGFRSEFVSASGSLQAEIDTKIGSLVEDTTPELSGDLQVNGHNLISNADWAIQTAGNNKTFQFSFSGDDCSADFENIGVNGQFNFVANGVGGSLSFTAETMGFSGEATFNNEIHVPSPTQSTHAATRGYVDGLVGGSGKAITGSDGNTVVSGTSTINIAGFRTEFVSASGSLQTQINSNSAAIATINVDEVEPAIVGTDGIAVVSGSNTTTIQGFRTEFVNASGSLQTQIITNANAIANLDATYATDANVATVSGHLQTQITTVQNQVNNLDATYATDAQVATISGHLQSAIDAVESSDVDSINGVVGSVTIAAAGYSSTATNGQTITITTPVPHAIIGGGDISVVTGTNTVRITDNNRAIIGSDGVSVASGTNTITLTGFRTEFVSASGSLQTQITSAQNAINNLDATYATDAQLTSVSGHLQTQIDTANADVSSLNGLQGSVTIAGSNIGVSVSSQTINLSAPVPNAIIGGSNVTITSGTNTTTITSAQPPALISANTNLLTISSGTNTITFNPASDRAILGDAFLSVVTGTNSINLSADAIVGTANQITVTSGTNTVTASIPSTFIAPGSIASTTTISGGTGISTGGQISGQTGAFSGGFVVSGTRSVHDRSFLTVRETDGSPSISQVIELVLTTGTVTDLGNGRVQIATGGGGGGGGAFSSINGITSGDITINGTSPTVVSTATQTITVSTSPVQTRLFTEVFNG